MDQPRVSCPAKTARQVGQENLSKPVISAALSERQKARSERVELTGDMVIEELRRALRARCPRHRRKIFSSPVETWVDPRGIFAADRAARARPPAGRGFSIPEVHGPAAARAKRFPRAGRRPRTSLGYPPAGLPLDFVGY